MLLNMLDFTIKAIKWLFLGRDRERETETETASVPSRHHAVAAEPSVG